MAVGRLLQTSALSKASLGSYLHNRGVSLSPEVFWPQFGEPEGRQKPFWPCLESIAVLFSSISFDGSSLHIKDLEYDEFESPRLDMSKVNPLLVAAARAAKQMPKLLEMKVTIKADPAMRYPLCEMAFAARDYCTKEDLEGDHAAVRNEKSIIMDSRKLRLDEVDLSKPRVSVVMPIDCTVDGLLGQVWKTSKGEDVDYKLRYCMLPHDDYEDYPDEWENYVPDDYGSPSEYDDEDNHDYILEYI